MAAGVAVCWQLEIQIKAYHGEWDEAIEEFSRGDDDANANACLAIALAHTARQQEYEKIRHRFFEYAVSRQEFGKEYSPRPFLLFPVTGPDLELVNQFAELTVLTNAPEWYAPKRGLAKALAKYRVGRFETAGVSGPSRTGSSTSLIGFTCRFRTVWMKHRAHLGPRCNERTKRTNNQKSAYERPN